MPSRPVISLEFFRRPSSTLTPASLRWCGTVVVVEVAAVTVDTVAAAVAVVVVGASEQTQVRRSSADDKEN